jgi:hypothetical protein
VDDMDAHDQPPAQQGPAGAPSDPASAATTSQPPAPPPPPAPPTAPPAPPPPPPFGVYPSQSWRRRAWVPIAAGIAALLLIMAFSWTVGYVMGTHHGRDQSNSRLDEGQRRQFGPQNPNGNQRGFGQFNRPRLRPNQSQPNQQPTTAPSVTPGPSKTG